MNVLLAKHAHVEAYVRWESSGKSPFIGIAPLYPGINRALPGIDRLALQAGDLLRVHMVPPDLAWWPSMSEARFIGHACGYYVLSPDGENAWCIPPAVVGLARLPEQSPTIDWEPYIDGWLDGWNQHHLELRNPEERRSIGKLAAGLAVPESYNRGFSRGATDARTGYRSNRYDESYFEVTRRWQVREPRFHGVRPRPTKYEMTLAVIPDTVDGALTPESTKFRIGNLEGQALPKRITQDHARRLVDGSIMY
jgi:hypothetical protein